MANILVVAAHPDDEILGCGGTLTQHFNRGDNVTVLLLSKGRDKIDYKRLEKISNFSYCVYKHPAQSFETTNITKLVKDIETVALKCNPDIVYTHSDKDLQIDHRKTLEAVLVAFRPTNKAIKILSFEILSSSEWNTTAFQPNYYNNIADTINDKTDLMEFYYSELREYPHPRSIQGIEIKAQSRGLEVGMEYAEAFEIVRIINN